MDISNIVLPAHQNQKELRRIRELKKNPSWWSQPENKELAQQILERSQEAFYQYEPYYNRRNQKPGWQWSFMAAAGTHKGRVALGGNRIGKSDQGAYECVLAITGKHPFRHYPAKGKGWIIGLDYNMVRDVNLPKFNKFLPRNYNISSDFKKADNIWEIKGEGREWIVQFKSSDSGRAKFQGDEIDWAWFDEEPQKIDVFSETMMRLVDRAGNWWMTATPINGTAWLKKLSESTDTFTTFGSMWDNPYLPEEEIEKAKQRCESEDEILVRIEGMYLTFGGKPVFNIRALNRMLEGLKNDLPTSELIFYEAA